MTNIIRTPIFIILITLNTAFHGSLVSLCAPIKLLIPISAWRNFWGRISYWIAGGFIITNNFLLKIFFHIEWDIDGLENLDRWKNEMYEKPGMKDGIKVPVKIENLLKDKNKATEFVKNSSKIVKK